MRAAAGASHEEGGRHLSGAERLVPREAVTRVTRELYGRAEAQGLEPDYLRLTVERVAPEQIARTPCLPVTTSAAADPAAARRAASELLRAAGVSVTAVERGFTLLERGARAAGAPARGAALLHAETGARLDPDPERGVRARHFDYSPEARQELEAALRAHGLEHFRIREALAVATKVLWSGVLAELCWSDAPDYTPGYVAARAAGYIRFPHFKPPGAAGGRVFYLAEAVERNAVIRRLQDACLLIEGPVSVRGPRLRG